MQIQPDKIETRVFHSQELRAKPDSRTIEGYAAVFNSESEDLGWYVEEIAPGAFDDVMEDDVRALFNHDPNLILARTTSGTLKLGIDEKGLTYSFDAPETTTGNDLLESVRRGDVSQSSFGFIVGEQRWDELEMMKDGKRWFKTKRTILKIDRLFDVSPVTYPAYPDTTVAKRAWEGVKKPEPETVSISKQQARSRAIKINDKISQL